MVRPECLSVTRYRSWFVRTIRNWMELCLSWLFTRVYVEPFSNTFISIRAAVMYGSPSITGCEDVSYTKKC